MEMAKRMHTSRSQLDRFLDPDNDKVLETVRGRRRLSVSGFRLALKMHHEETARGEHEDDEIIAAANASAAKPRGAIDFNYKRVFDVVLNLFGKRAGRSIAREKLRDGCIFFYKPIYDRVAFYLTRSLSNAPRGKGFIDRNS
jgi:hypothetical protein